MAMDVSTCYRAPTTARQMADAAHRWLDSLNAEQREAATFPFVGDERYLWNYRPDGSHWNGGTVWHRGLRLVNMTHPQQRLALALFEAGLSERGVHQANRIIALEAILRETERIEQRVSGVLVRDPEIYAFAVFGEPGGAESWSWRAGGHHLGLHFTIVERDLIAPVPLFFGANPAEVRHGPEAGSRTLPEEEDLARDLLAALEPDQKATAIVDPVAPRDIITDAYRSADPSALPSGLTFSRMSGQQRERLVRLIRHYVDRAVGEIAANEWRKIERAGLDGIGFAWAGPEERGHGHYYAVKGPTFMLEYDNTQNGANHIHSVWRDFTGDWGEDLLARHYAESHAG
jgi:hypothetical protein